VSVAERELSGTRLSRKKRVVGTDPKTATSVWSRSRRAEIPPARLLLPAGPGRLSGTTAFEWLSEAAESGFPCYPLFEHDPNLEALHRDSRWSPLMAEIKQNWERYSKLISEKI
jgi:hypothetical protein